MKPESIMRRRNFLSHLTSQETGQALIIVLIFVLLGSLTLIPTLAYMRTALKSGVSYENKSKEFFTADAGIENGLWRIKYDYMGPDYDPYDFNTTWIYDTDPLNNLSAEVSVKNVWLPSNVHLDDPDINLTPAQARAMIESGKLVISGTSGAIPGQPYHIKMDFTPAEGDNLTIKSIGIWLPQGFNYVRGSSDLEKLSPFNEWYPASVNIATVPGGQTVVWKYNDNDYPHFTTFPGVDPKAIPMTANFTFSYTPPADNPSKLPVAIAWVTTDMDPPSPSGLPNPDNVPISWDTDTRIYKITSLAGDTNIEAYSSKTQLRNLNGAIGGDCVALGNSLMDNPNMWHRYQTWLPSSDSTLTTNPADADVIAAYLYWSGFRLDNTLFSDTCSSANLTSSWQNGGDWSYYYYPNYYRGQHTGADSRRYLTMSNGINLGGYPSGTVVTVSWSQSVSALQDIFSDDCNDFTYWNKGAAWSTNQSFYNWYFQAKSTTADNDTARLLTMKSSQNLTGYNSVTISWKQCVSGAAAAGDGLDFALSSNNGSTWSSYTQAFRGNIGTSWIYKSYTIPVDFGSEYLTSGFMIKFKLVGFTGSVYCNIDDIKITPSYTASDGLDFALYDGTTWSSNIQAFRGNIGTSWINYSCNLTGQYLTSSAFKLRFYLVGMGGSQQYANIDDIKIIVRPPDTSITFKINDQQVYLDANDNPQAGAQPLTTSSGSIIVNTGWGGYSYACKRDVSKLVKKYPVVPGEQHHTGNAKYTVGDVQADTGIDVSYAGWSLIIIYCSPQTAGHYLYLYDVFSFNPGGSDLDFDHDGKPGGDITGFRFPEPIRDKYGVITENVAAKLTAFVGEGDDWLSGDCIEVTGQQSGNYTYLSNPASPANNVWNSASWPIATDVGVDIDTFQILWSSNILTPNDTKLHLDMYSGQDAWNLIYFILSVRSQTVTRGTDYFLIDGR
jgi:hypothetical protein